MMNKNSAMYQMSFLYPTYFSRKFHENQDTLASMASNVTQILSAKKLPDKQQKIKRRILRLLSNFSLVP